VLRSEQPVVYHNNVQEKALSYVSEECSRIHGTSVPRLVSITKVFQKLVPFRLDKNAIYRYTINNDISHYIEE